MASQKNTFLSFDKIKQGVFNNEFTLLTFYNTQYFILNNMI